MRKRVILNDQGLYLDCILDEDRISFEFEKELSILNNKVKISKENDSFYCYLGLKKFLKIKNGEITKLKDISTTEFRILCALSHRVDYINKLKKGEETTIVKEFNRIVNILSSLPKRWNKHQIHKTELHTHFSEILNPMEFIEFLNKYNVTYPIDSNGNLDFKNGRPVSYDELVELGLKDKLISSLRLDISTQSSFDDLEKVVNYNRNNLIQRIIKKSSDDIFSFKSKEYKMLCKKIEELKTKMSFEEIEKLGLTKKEKGKYREEINKELMKLITKKNHMISDLVYDDLLDISLKKLDSENVEYSEISFSNPKRLEYFCKTHNRDSRFNLLLSINREDKLEKYLDSALQLEGLLNTDKVIGVDLMGFERPLVESEYKDLKERILCLLPVLHIHPNSLLRIHASEFPNTKDNLLQTLRILDEATIEINSKCKELFDRDFGMVPPPRIRIGHGVNINKSPELIDLMKKYDVIVEINASSNYALGQIDSIDDIPLDYYKKNGINYVISTDGGGVYSTSILQEENLLRKHGLLGSSETEKTQIITNGSGASSEEDLQLYKDIKEKLDYGHTKETYSSYMDALKKEDEIFSNVSEKEKIDIEMKYLSKYLLDHGFDYDFDGIYYYKMMDIVKELNNSNRSEIAKEFLYLLELEVIPDRQPLFKSLYYLDQLKSKDKYGLDNTNRNNYDIDEINNKFEIRMFKLYEVIKKEYLEEREKIKISIKNELPKGRSR